MKQHQLIFLNMTQPGACIYANRNEWTLEHVTQPRPSCLDRWAVRNSLRTMEPGTRATINGVDVRRKLLTHQAARYAIDGRWYDTDKTIAILESMEDQKAS